MIEEWRCPQDKKAGKMESPTMNKPTQAEVVEMVKELRSDAGHLEHDGFIQYPKTARKAADMLERLTKPPGQEEVAEMVISQLNAALELVPTSLLVELEDAGIRNAPGGDLDIAQRFEWRAAEAMKALVDAAIRAKGEIQRLNAAGAAGRDDVLEEAAKCIEGFIPVGVDPIGPLHRAGRAFTATHGAAAIRALKDNSYW